MSDRHPMAIDNRVGDPRPVYDQYAVNDPQSLDKQADGQIAQEVGVGGSEKGFAAPEFSSDRTGDVISTPASRAHPNAKKALGEA